MATNDDTARDLARSLSHALYAVTDYRDRYGHMYGWECWAAPDGSSVDVDLLDAHGNVEDSRTIALGQVDAVIAALSRGDAHDVLALIDAVLATRKAVAA